MPDSAPDNAPGTRVAAVVPLVGSWQLDKSFDYSIPSSLEKEVVAGSLVRMPFGRRRARGVVVAVSDGPASAGLVELSGVVGPSPVAPPPLIDVFRWMAIRYCAPLPSVLERIIPTRVRVKEATATKSPWKSLPLLSRYRGAERLSHSLENARPGTFALRRLPGDDPASLIGEIVGQCNQGNILVAVPEVRYGSAVLDVVKTMGGVRLDSGVSDAERSAAWFGLAGGAASLGVGGRSAVLAPAPDLRLIVLDDEHDSSFKEDRSPRYDARRVAQHRARTEGAICILMSTSPTVATGFAASSGTMGAIEPDRALERNHRPIVEIVEKPHDRALSSALHGRVQATLRQGRSVALLTPSPGYARCLWCASCRRTVRCERCESGMSLFSSSHRIRCPHCGYEDSAPDVCPSCGSADFRFLGAGSERLAEQAAAAFPRGSVVRMDPAVLTGKGPFDMPKSDRPLVYVTTWIGTKQSIRPDVGLVGILDADALIRRPVWNAAESGYQALAEMSAWAGPGSEGGRLLIQTSEPGHHAVQAIARADYGYFMQRELSMRRELAYPPFTELMRIAAQGDAAQEWIERAAKIAGDTGADVLGPVLTDVRSARDTPASKGLELLVKTKDAQEVARAVRVILPDVPRNTRLRVDTDPR